MRRDELPASGGMVLNGWCALMPSGPCRQASSVGNLTELGVPVPGCHFAPVRLTRPAEGAMEGGRVGSCVPNSCSWPRSPRLSSSPLIELVATVAFGEIGNPGQ